MVHLSVIKILFMILFYFFIIPELLLNYLGLESDSGDDDGTPSPVQAQASDR
jgi:hypothetical protein